ncbi:MAG: VWA domain-containing protein [Chloroflexi bacterium]|nr:VWA domain-containing protein [Chloroflexota bacterium]
MELGNPLALALLALAVPILVVERHSLRSLTTGRRAATLALRLLVLAALVGALADPRLIRGVDRLAIAYLLDASASVTLEQRSQADEWVRRALAAKGPDDLAAVIVFGAEPLVERAPSVVRDLPAIATQPDPDQTDIAAALRLGLGVLPSDAGRKIVVLTDGHETKGRAAREARLLAAAGVPVSVVPLEAVAGVESLIRAVDGPSLVREGEAFRVRVTVESSGSSNGRIHLLIDDRVALTQAIALHPGTNSFLLAHDPLPPGFHTIQAQLDADADGLAENNEGMSYVVVAGQPRALLVEGESGEGRYLAEALRAGGIVVDLSALTGLPPDLTGYRGYDGVVLINVPATRLTANQMLGLRGAVQRLGIGLVVIGGERSFGAGGYGRTALADALPVRMERRGLRAQSAAALLLVIDTSGSMASGAGGMSKMALARESAMQALDLLSDLDVAGVLAFEDTPSWVLPLGPLGDRDTVRSAVSRLQPGGGTAIYPALEEAAQAMTAVNAKVRHIILLTDGISPAGDYAGLAERLRQQSITLSTIAVGLDADQALLRMLAESGNGRYYEGSDPFDLPQLLVKETLEVARAAIVEEDFRPLVVGSSSVLEGLRVEALPLLRGYVATTPKPSAQVSLASPHLDPLLAEWQYGLGRVVAWTSDAKNRWAANWLEWGDAVPFWTRLVKRSFPSPQDQSLQTQVTVEEGVARVTVDAIGDDRSFRNFLPLRLEAIGPGGAATAAPLRQVGPGRYTAELPASAPGAYLVRVSQADAAGQPESTQTTGFGVGYSAEYRQTGQNLELLREISRITGGRLLSDPAESVRHDVRARGGQPIWPWLTVLAAVLFLADVAARRVRLDTLAVVRKALAAFRTRWPVAPALRPAGVRLLAAKQRVPSTVSLAARRQVAIPRGNAAPAGLTPARRPPLARPAVRPAAPRPSPPGSRPASPASAAPASPRPAGSRELGARLIQAKQRAGKK